MVFSSTLFLLFFLPIFLIGYHLLPHKHRNWWVLLASVLFYSWSAPVFIFVIIGSVVVDYYLIEWLHNSNDANRRKVLLFLSIFINLGLLLYFKYANFFVENVNMALTSFGFNHLEWVKIGLPVGISFYTFQTLTYSIDVYRGVHKPFKNPVQYLVYILLFPQMIAGPIVRFNLIADQIVDRKHLETIDNKLLGFFRFVIGLSKKMLIANVLGAQADAVFDLSLTELGTQTAWIGIIAYSFQIYFDFSGYSDMAIGIGRMIGFTFPENFNNPYTSRSITEFWRRWHMTLGTWMRDYLYIPLGGNQLSVKRMYFNLWFVFILSGLWHGAAWNFIIWGMFHGLFLVLDKLFLLKFLNKIGKYPSVVLTFLITLIGWVFFRCDSIEQAVDFISVLFSFNDLSTNFYFDSEFTITLALAFVFSFFTLNKYGLQIEQKFFFGTTHSNRTALVLFVVCLLILVLCVGAVLSSGFNPFIYFRF